ncbi:hypothetical protein [Rahnella woolbedingensis]|uniref:Uncharacterized protein n=1 Tax=Rahnella woolbedingensis TaxID=1510574 RepID=A0A419NBL4_9GAMM|nr:hypothetical protein [Rahnella woolbedingensis]RJT45697.1 hypothetical protein D6C13_06115 [Rahnella woolbedingensis]
MKLVPKKERAIDESFKIVQSPVFVVTRHGWRKRCLSRSAALNNLAHYMVTKTFRRSGWPTHEDDTPVIRDGVLIHQMGEHTASYFAAHYRCIRRIRLLLARKLAIAKWQEKHEEMKQQYAELLSNKPF